ncbi:MAG TPA: fumarylacetoacetate hydrolase family protein [Spirochaetia bacterium]|nr:fumarylacetoacetate hydrolase family protein [Spirochaetia bacterium]
MRIARFEADGRIQWGAVESVESSGDRVRAFIGDAFGSRATTEESRPLDSVRLLAPVLPSKIFALAHNYSDHLHGREPPREPQVFLKVPSSVIGPGDTIRLPSGQGRIDEEGELVVVMGRRCRSVPRERALDYVLGYTCGNDVSARAWQKNDLNWWRAKSTDTFSPLGPFIVTDVDPSAAVISARINDREVQRCTSSDLIFDVPALIEWISRWVTLEPGDLIYTGTSGEPAELHAGDSVEVAIGGIGVLKNPVAAE